MLHGGVSLDHALLVLHYVICSVELSFNSRSVSCKCQGLTDIPKAPSLVENRQQSKQDNAITNYSHTICENQRD